MSDAFILFLTITSDAINIAITQYGIWVFFEQPFFIDVS